MAHLPLFAFALALGFLAAIPIGPVQIEMAKRAVTGHFRAAMAVVAGSVISDALYGGVALFGVAPALERPWVVATAAMTGGVAMSLLAVATWRRSRAPHELHLEGASLCRRRWGLLTGFLLGSSNPPIILSWVLGVTFAKRFGLATPLTQAGKLWFVAGGAMGLGSYLVVLGSAVHRLRHFFSTPAIGRLYAGLAVALGLLSACCVWSAARFWLGGA